MKILGIEVAVVPDARIAPERGNFGEWRPGRSQIAIDPALVGDQQAETLLHEVVEAVVSGLGMELEHMKLQALARGVYAVLRDNPAEAQAIIRGKRVVTRVGA